MSDVKKAQADVPIHEVIANRWSPYVYDERPVSAEDLRAVFEAARWAASAFNEQPWRYIVATKDTPEAYEQLLYCLVEANQAWAKQAPVLGLSMVSLNYSRDGKTNGTALHDLGLATANLVLEAASRGLMVHQMGGILPGRAAELYKVPEGFQVLTGFALGYPGTEESELAKRDLTPRSRRPIDELVFGEAFGRAFTF
jgi:nitroreductase